MKCAESSLWHVQVQIDRYVGHTIMLSTVGSVCSTVVMQHSAGYSAWLFVVVAVVVLVVLVLWLCEIFMS